jgi:hypothetical protein
MGVGSRKYCAPKPPSSLHILTIWFNSAIFGVAIPDLVFRRGLPHSTIFRFEKDFGFYLSHEKTPSKMVSNIDP